MAQQLAVRRRAAAALPARRLRAAIFAGDRRVWRLAALLALPIFALVVFYCVRPLDYNTGTDSVEVHTYVTHASALQPVCVSGLEVPPGTSRLRVRVASHALTRPALDLEMRLGGQLVRDHLGPYTVHRIHYSIATFPLRGLPAGGEATPASLCLIAHGEVAFGGSGLQRSSRVTPTSVAGAPLSAAVSVWYVPRSGARRSYVSGLGAILDRAALFRGGGIGSWLYVIVLFIALPALAIASVRCLAMAVAGRPRRARPVRFGAWLFAIAAVNFACWAVMSPAFQSPDEDDHFAYTQSLVERGAAPSRDPLSPLRRWSSAETLALEDSSFLTDHEAADSRPPWLALQERRYEADAARLRPAADDGGGNETAAAHGPLYYGALAPAYAAAAGDPFAQLTLMRLLSALIGALTVLFAYLLVRELAPARPWLAVLAALLVAYQPMYGFISGSVNNDVGINAAAAGLELLLIRMLRRGITVRTGALTGALLLALPSIKGTGLSLYPVAALALAIVFVRHHRRRDATAWAAMAGSAALVGVLTSVLLGAFETTTLRTPSSAIGGNAAAAGDAWRHIPDFLSYVWQVFLPRLPFMTAHFPAKYNPAFVIFVERGWASFGWYTVAFPHWIYVVILVVMLAAIPLGAWAARREWTWVRAHAPELLVLIAMPVAVIVGFEAAYYTPGVRPVIAEVGRYTFPAIAPIAALVVGSLHAFGRGRRMLAAAVALLVAVIGLSYASQLLTLTGFFT